MRPNSFIAGAQKSGTTTLCRALELHPDAVLSSPKEPAFFCRERNMAQPELYESYFASAAARSPAAVIDGSNAYMFDVDAPSRIERMLGSDLRFVFCLREPSSRAISGYWHQAKKGRDARSLDEVLSFESQTLADALEEEEAKLAQALAAGRIDLSVDRERYDDVLGNFRYLRNSCYVQHIERFRQRFGAPAVKCVLFDDLCRDLDATARDVMLFLGLDPSNPQDRIELHSNPTQLERDAPLVGVLAGAWRRTPGLQVLRHVPGYQTLRDRLLYRRPPATSAGLKKRLRATLASEVVALEELLGRDLLAWRRQDAAVS